MKQLAKTILNQTTFYNGHGQMEISTMKIKDIMKVCAKMEKIMTKASPDWDSMIVFEMYTPCEWLGKHCSGAIYEVDGISKGKNKMWFAIDKVLL